MINDCMNRPSSFRKKPRIAAKRQFLICGEGQEDRDFLQFLKGLYYKRGSGFSIKIKSCSGGSPSVVVNEAYTRYKRSSIYHGVMVLLDGDRGEKENKEATNKAKKNKVKLIWQRPCLEGELLSILYPNRDFSQRDSEDLKKEWGEIKEGKGYEDVIPKDPNTPNTCLLYTSPSPRDRTRTRMPSSA